MIMDEARTTRRNLLRGLGTFGVLGVGGVGVVAYGQLFDTPYRNWLRATVVEALPGIDLPDNVLSAFVTDFENRFPPDRQTRVLVMGQGRSYELLKATSLRSNGFERLQRQVVTQFLYSTDFFALDDPKVTSLSYLGPTDPHACFGRNPFAQFLPT